MNEKYYKLGPLENYEHMYEYALLCLDEARDSAGYPPLTPEHKIAIGQALDKAVDRWVMAKEAHKVTHILAPEEPEPNMDYIFVAAVDAMTCVDRKRGYIKKVE
jgi:hypothetical protein